MKRPTSSPRQMCRFVAGIVVGGVCILTSPIVGLAEPGIEPPTDAATSGASDLAAPGRAGQWIKVDPQTGARVAPSAPIAAMAPDPAFSTSQQGLVEQAAPGGGVMVDLKGRFRSAATATLGTDGKAVVDCVPPGTAAREE
jgi:hypothetical protein